MHFVFETPEAERELSLDMPVPEVGSYLRWEFNEVPHANRIEPGLYRVTKTIWSISPVIVVRLTLEPVTS